MLFRSSIISRTLNAQESYRINEHEKIENSETFYSTVEWINDCDYYLKIDTSRIKNDDIYTDKDIDEINRNGGFHFQFLELDGTCAWYNVTITLDHEFIRFIVKTCKL